MTHEPNLPPLSKPSGGPPPPLVDGRLVLGWASLSLVYMLIGPVAGLLASMKLDDPTFIANVEWLQYGRVRLLHVNGVIFGTFTPAMFALMCYAVPRLTGRPLWGLRAAYAALVLDVVALVVGPTCLLLGIIQPIEAGEMPLVSDVIVTIVFTLMTACILMTIAERREKKMYVALWYWVASLVWTDLNYVLGNFILPYVPTGVNSAAMHGFYLHDVVGLWITPAGVGAAYYLLPVATGNVLYSHRLSIIGFWALAFFYPLNGIHHYIYSPIADWAQTIAIASSMMLILPVWAFSVNMWGTMRGSWGRWAGGDDYVVKFTMLGAVWYLITCFQGPTEALRSVQALTHFTDYNVGHAHSAVFAVFAIWAMAAVYLLVPRVTGRELWSTRLAGWHYWLEIFGFTTMFAMLSISGLVQGAMQQDADTQFIDTVQAVKPYWLMRTLGGTAMDVGLALFVVNIALTVKRGRRVRPAGAPGGAGGEGAGLPGGAGAAPAAAGGY
jgi:cytochrome c oxidase cbb3-type subunit 1